MNTKERKGFLKGVGITMIICATVFYGLILNYRSTLTMEEYTQEQLIEEARRLGMVFVTELENEEIMTEAYIINEARKYGMSFKEESK